jgi:hypothetical protein
LLQTANNHPQIFRGTFCLRVFVCGLQPGTGCPSHEFHLKRREQQRHSASKSSADGSADSGDKANSFSDCHHGITKSFTRSKTQNSTSEVLVLNIEKTTL